MFVVLTGGDKLNQSDRQSKVQEYKRKCSTVLSIMEKRVFEVTNYLPEELDDHCKMAKNLKKEIKILLALNFILQPCYTPDWCNQSRNTGHQPPDRGH